MITESTLQLTFKNDYMLSFSELLKKMQNHLKRLLKCSSCFQLYVYARPDFSPRTSIKTTYGNRLKTGRDVKIHLSPIKPDMKEIYKNVKQCYFFRVFVLVCFAK